jgi:hypothetical protein
MLAKTVQGTAGGRVSALDNSPRDIHRKQPLPYQPPFPKNPLLPPFFHEPSYWVETDIRSFPFRRPLPLST